MASDKRKIVQISACGSDTITTDTQTISSVYALCDDGTVWFSAAQYGWVQVSDIPQEGDKRD